MYKEIEVEKLVGEVFTSVLVSDDKSELVMKTKDKTFTMFHDQDCCESVELDEIHGDLDDLVGKPILKATESTNEGETECGTETWTFYNLATIKGDVQLKWYGESNGYYSEEVTIREEVNK